MIYQSLERSSTNVYGREQRLFSQRTIGIYLIMASDNKNAAVQLLKTAFIFAFIDQSVLLEIDPENFHVFLNIYDQYINEINTHAR